MFRLRYAFYVWQRVKFQENNILSSCKSTKSGNEFVHKRFLSISVIKYGDKPVIMSAADILKDESMSSNVTPAAPTVDSATGAVIDPPFVDLGLATSWWPTDIIESILESFYIYTGSPWWMTIAGGTMALRLILFPFFVEMRKTSIRMSNHGKTATELRDNYLEKMRSKNIHEAKAGQLKYRQFAKKHKVGNGRMLLVNSFQPLVFISCLRALNAMTAVPVPSIAASSFLWVPSLVGVDPYRLLPGLSGVFIGLNIYAAIKFSNSNVPEMMKKHALKISILPVIFMPLVFGNWSGAFGVYLLTNSFCTLSMTLFLSNKKVQKLFNMPTPLPKNPGQISGFSYIKDQLIMSKEKTKQRHEQKEINKLLKQERKQRKKELKGSPPKLFEIGTEAKLIDNIPDFQRDWRPPKPDIFK